MASAHSEGSSERRSRHRSLSPCASRVDEPLHGGGPKPKNQQKKGVDWSCGQKLCTRNFFISNLAVSLPVPVPEVLLLHCRVHAQKPTSGFAAEGSGGAGRGEESQSARCNLPREQFSAKDVTCTFPRHASRAPSASITPNCGQDRD